MKLVFNQFIPIFALFVIGLMISTSLVAQSTHKNLRHGDENYYQKDYVQAEEEYRKALQKDEKSINGNHNLGNALYNQERYDEAAKYFESAALQAENDKEKAMSYHNLGNAYLSQLKGVGSEEQAAETLKKSIEAYKQSLKLNSKDDATRYNLAYAQKLNQQIQQQQQQPQNNQGEGNPPPPQDEQENPSSGGGGEQEEDKKNDQPKPNPNQGESMSKEEAERLVKIMEEEERKVQEKMNKKNKQPNPSGKDW